MAKKVILLTIPALRHSDLSNMPELMTLVKGGSQARLQHSFPSVTWPAQANLLTGQTPEQHGVVANGFFWRDSGQVEMWTAWNKVIEAPQIWDVLPTIDPNLKSAAWFPMLSKGCNADVVCMPAPIHQPDGSEDLWCYTKPQEFYGQLLETLGHFPLQHFWGPLANIKSSRWIADSAALAFKRFAPDFFYIYLPHLDYAAQKSGPNSSGALKAVEELDAVIGQLGHDLQKADEEITWLIVSEYVITEVDHVCYPNRRLREAGLLSVHERDDGEYLDFANSQAWAMVDHQFSHIFVNHADPRVIQQVTEIFKNKEGIDQVLALEDRHQLKMNHPRSGEVILVSAPNSWQAYYWWLEDQSAPGSTRTVDIHRKPGYDPVELHFDPQTNTIPLDASLIRGSHGAGAVKEEQQGVILSSSAEMLTHETLAETDVFDLVLNSFRPS